MKIGILTLETFRQNARAIGGRGAQISTTGPVHDPPDFLGIFLHPSADGRAWENDAHQVVVTADQVREWPLAGTVVFVGACYGLENRAMIDALFAAGAQAVIAGPGDNFGGVAGVLAGADVLARAVLAAIEAGMDVAKAWQIAQATIALAVKQGVPGATDAQSFQLLQRAPVAETIEAYPEAPPRRSSWRNLGGWIGGIIALITLWVMLWSWNPTTPGLLTTFSSIVAPPGVTQWEKTLDRNGGAVDLWWSAPVAITNTDELTVHDAITATVGYTLTETWDTSAISLSGYITSAGNISLGSGSLTWTWLSPSGGAVLTKQWVVIGTWSTSTLTEVLTTDSGTTTQTIALVRQTPATPTPTLSPTLTSVPTQTPRPKPTRISISDLYSGTLTPEVWITPYPTPYIAERPIVIVYLPLICHHYETVTLPGTPEVTISGPTLAYSGQALDYTLSVLGTGDGVHTIINTLPLSVTLVSATSGYVGSGTETLTWIEEDLTTWDGSVRLTAPSIAITTVITNTVRVLWGTTSMTAVMTTTIAP